MATDDLRVEGWGGGQRLDVYLFKAGLAPSRSKARAAVDAGEVLLDGKRVTAHVLVRDGQALTFVAPEATSKVSRDIPAVRVVHESDDYFVVEKPAGVVVHGGPGVTGPLLTDALLVLDKKIAKVGERDRPGIVHRLDRDVSGLMVVARTATAYKHFTELFSQQQVRKVYTALAHGVVGDEVGEIRLKIARSTRHARMAARPESQEGKTAVTHYEVLERFPNATLLSVRILTGRTHQIRAHLYGIGHPVVGDPLYALRRKTPLTLGRPFLHAAQLSFIDPSGVDRTFESPLPPELAGVLAALRAKYRKTSRT
ncbi:RluA family pseudouridine synthase [Patescibacteria group bacterium]|nr:MAG: RluA family pseudouridine synthase [Patescibacteria group bacterium]